MRSVLFLTALFLSLTAEAKIFSNQFIEFQLPDKWECQLDGTEWICQSTDEQKKRDALIVLAAKIKKEGMDSLDEYEKHLQQKQTYASTAGAGEQIVSEPRYVKRVDLTGKTWIDALHLQSEIPDFYTRYLATVEADIGILLTFNVRKDKFNDYAPDIEALVKSLRCFRKPGALNEDPNKVAVTDATQQTANQVLFGEDKKAHNTTATTNQEGNAEMVLLLLVVAAAGGFIIWKKKRDGR